MEWLERLYGWAAPMRATRGGAVRWRNEYQMGAIVTGRPADVPADHQHNWKATRGLAMGDEAVVRVACFSFVLAVAAEVAVEARQRELAVVRPLFGEGAVADRFSALVFSSEMNRSSRLSTES